MPSVSEATNAKTPIGSALAAGADVLSYNQTIMFTQYTRVVLPLDGYVYWVSTVQRNQVEDQTYDVKQCIFTAEDKIDDFDVIGPTTMWIGQFLDFRFAFSRQSNFYQQADLYHYVGDAIYPDMETQIIDDPSTFSTINLIVSNSLPIWLAMNPSNPPFPYPGSSAIALYPSFIVPDDVTPPFAAVNIQPEQTEALAAAPFINSVSSHYQLTKDVVNITFFGLDNNTIMDFVDYVINLSIQDDANFGIMNIPIVRDLKRTQSEISAIAMKKSVTFEINYYQARVRTVAQQYISSVIINYVPGV